MNPVAAYQVAQSKQLGKRKCYLILKCGKNISKQKGDKKARGTGNKALYRLLV